MPLYAVNAPIVLTARATHGPGSSRFSLSFLYSSVPDIVDIKPANMEELTEVITAAEFHPHHCNTFVYSSSKGTIRLCDMRASALCDRHTKCEYPAQGPWGEDVPWPLACGRRGVPGRVPSHLTLGLKKSQVLG